MFPTFLRGIFSIIGLLTIVIASQVGAEVPYSSGLTREDFYQLDWESTLFYYDGYPELDRQNSTNYDEQLHRTIKTLRSTMAALLNDFRYTSVEVVQNSAGRQVNHAKCARQLRGLVSLAKTRLATPNSAPLSAIDFLESSGNAEAGVLNGNFLWFGSYDSCLHAEIPAEFLPVDSMKSETEDTFDSANGMTGRYCVAHLKSKSWPKFDKHYGDRISIKLGVCLPESCHTGSYELSSEVRRNVDYIARHRLPVPFDGDNYQVDYLYCLPDEDSPFRQLEYGTKVFIVFVLVWAALLFYANRERTTVDRNSKRKKSFSLGGVDKDNEDIEDREERIQNSVEDVLIRVKSRNPKPLFKQAFNGIEKAFSIRDNVNFLMQIEAHQDEGRSNNNENSSNESSKVVAATSDDKKPVRRQINLSVLNGVKVICTTSVIMAHVPAVLLDRFSHLKFFDELTCTGMLVYVRNGIVVPNCFYMITGTIISYKLFRRRDHVRIFRKPAFWLILFLQRYFKLLPGYFLMFWYVKHVAPYTGSGVYWNSYRTDQSHPRSFCATEPWSTMLTMSASKLPLNRHCLPQAWHMSNDVRALIVLPIYMLIFSCNTTIGFMAILATNALAAYKMAHYFQNSSINLGIMFHMKPTVYPTITERLHEPYTDFTIRLSTYLIGVGAGHLLHLYEMGKICWPDCFKKIGIKLALLIIVTTASFSCFGRCLSRREYLFDDSPEFKETAEFGERLYLIVIWPMMKIIPEIAFCSILILLATNAGGYKWIREVLSSKAANLLAFLSFSVYLIHLEILFYHPTGSVDFSPWNLTIIGSAVAVLSYTLAFFFTLFYELPINNIVRQLMFLGLDILK